MDHHFRQSLPHDSVNFPTCLSIHMPPFMAWLSARMPDQVCKYPATSRSTWTAIRRRRRFRDVARLESQCPSCTENRTGALLSTGNDYMSRRPELIPPPNLDRLWRAFRFHTYSNSRPTNTPDSNNKLDLMLPIADQLGMLFRQDIAGLLSGLNLCSS